MKIQLFFGMGSGRVASMGIANALNFEAECDCLHEGKFRKREVSGDQVLPFLTLQNRLSYENPQRASELIHQYRNQLYDIAAKRGVKYFGDIAYNNSPFVLALYQHYPDAKFILQFRDCLNFVGSCTGINSIDVAPVGWPPKGKPLSRLEQYIALGRIQPREESDEATDWHNWSFISKNIWLWAETNQIILSALDNIPKHLVYHFRFETFCEKSLHEYHHLRNFLGINAHLPENIHKLLTSRPVNRRNDRIHCENLDELTEQEQHIFEQYATPIRRLLGYI